MAQEKKALYDLYTRLTDVAVKKMKGVLVRPNSQKADNKAIIKMIMDSSREMIHSLDFLIFSEERYWEKQGNHVIFPESAEVLHNLLRAKYHMDSPEGFTLPYDSFMLAVPHGYSHNGIKLESFMVTMVPYLNSQHYTTIPFCKDIGIHAPSSYVHEQATEEARCITITYRDPVTRVGYIRTLQIDTYLPHILKCETVEEYHAAVGDYDAKVGVIGLNKQELETQFLAIKLVAALGVYHMATEGKRLSDGFPGSQAPRLQGYDKKHPLVFSTLKNSVKVDAGTTASRDAHYRTWFFRQLRDERFYRGEHEKAPRGSRYSFVADTVVGQKVSPHTQAVTGEKGRK
jgi:hypothetical protein